MRFNTSKSNLNLLWIINKSCKWLLRISHPEPFIIMKIPEKNHFCTVPLLYAGFTNRQVCYMFATRITEFAT